MSFLRQSVLVEAPNSLLCSTDISSLLFTVEPQNTLVLGLVHGTSKRRSAPPITLLEEIVPGGNLTIAEPDERSSVARCARILLDSLAG